MKYYLVYTYQIDKNDQSIPRIYVDPCGFFHVNPMITADLIQVRFLILSDDEITELDYRYSIHGKTLFHPIQLENGENSFDSIKKVEASFPPLVDLPIIDKNFLIDWIDIDWNDDLSSFNIENISDVIEKFHSSELKGMCKDCEHFYSDCDLSKAGENNNCYIEKVKQSTIGQSAKDFVKKCNVFDLVQAMEGGCISLNSLLVDFVKTDFVKQYYFSMFENEKSKTESHSDQMIDIMNADRESEAAKYI